MHVFSLIDLNFEKMQKSFRAELKRTKFSWNPCINDEKIAYQKSIYIHKWIKVSKLKIYLSIYIRQRWFLFYKHLYFFNWEKFESINFFKFVMSILRIIHILI